jgi:hypothetical protein
VESLPSGIHLRGGDFLRIRAHALHEKQRIRARPEPVRKHLNPPDIALLRVEGEPMGGLGREKLPFDVAWRRDLLRRVGLRVRFLFGDDGTG